MADNTICGASTDDYFHDQLIWQLLSSKMTISLSPKMIYLDNNQNQTTLMLLSYIKKRKESNPVILEVGATGNVHFCLKMTVMIHR